MNFQRKPIPAAVPLRSTVPASTAPANGVGTTSIGEQLHAVRPQTGAAGSPNRSALCPDCNSEFSDRIRDEDTGMSYPVDPGEHYCLHCDALWTDAELQWITPRIDQPTYGEARAHIDRVFGLGKPEGWSRVEL